MNKKELGDWGEEKAAVYLKKMGYQILERNFRNRFGEIDLIARDKDFLVFVEVKTRSNNHYGSPQAAVDNFKQQKIRKIASYYLLNNISKDVRLTIRFDVIAINYREDQSKVEHLKNAF